MYKSYRCLIAFMAAGFFLTACSGTRPTTLGIQGNGQFAPCPATPNCVSSFAPADDKMHYIEPLPAAGDQWRELSRTLDRTPRIAIIAQDGPYIRAEATTRLMRFVDDLEFLYHPEQSIIHVRSASRIGRYDFGANRRRIERLRTQLTD
jgi:uncharacterized protein (DUF1499 family)